MAWLRIDDNLSNDARLLAAGDAAAWLYVAMLIYCARYATDGVVKMSVLPVLGCTGWKKALPALLASGDLVVQRSGDELYLPQFLETNDDKATRAQKAAENKARQRKFRAKQPTVTRYEHDTQHVTQRVTNAAPVPSPVPTPVQERTTPLPRQDSSTSAQRWKRALAIAHRAIEAFPDKPGEWAEEFKQLCVDQGLDYGERGGADQRPLYARAIDAASETRERRQGERRAG